MYSVSITPLQLLSNILPPVILFSSFLLLALYYWIKQRKIIATLIIFFAVYLFRYYWAVKLWLNGLGSDSFEEAQNFELGEAFHFVKTLLSNFIAIDYRFIIIGGLIATLFTALLLAFIHPFLYLLKKKEWFARSLLYFALLCFVTPIIGQIQSMKSSFAAKTQAYNAIQSNFSATLPQEETQQIHDQKIHIAVYIGESTTSQHWSLYHYPDQTTPLLEALKKSDPGLLVFSNVSATHTHFKKLTSSTKCGHTA